MKRTSLSFTLVEMIVALAVLSILTVILFSVLSEVSRAISLSSGRTGAFTDAQIVLDQLSRELQQAVNDPHYKCFVGHSNEIHFVATIDNNSGDEDAAVGYCFRPFTATNNPYCLAKTLQFSTKVNKAANDNWLVGAARTNDLIRWWDNKPPLDQYVTVLENVRSVSFDYRDSAPPNTTHTDWDYDDVAHPQMLPAFIIITLGVCDPQDVVRYKSVGSVPGPLVRTFSTAVYLPRQSE